MLTDTKIQAALKDATKETILSDGSGGKGEGSLKLRIRPASGGKFSASWVADWKRDGKRHRAMIGTYPEVSLKDARAKFQATSKDGTAQATDEAPAEAPARTVGELFAGYVASMRAAGKISADDVEISLGKAATSLGKDTPAGAVTTTDVSKALAVIYERGARRMADLTRSHIHAAFNWGMAAANDYMVPEADRVPWGVAANPAAGIRKDEGASTPRDRNLSPAEIHHVWQDTLVEFQGFADQTGKVIRLVLLCGQRVRETLRVDGADVDVAAKLWRMPAHKTKGKKQPHIVPLPDEAVAIFQELIDQYGDGPLIHGITEQSLGRAVSRWCEDNKDKVARFTPRDLRRTWKSRAGDGPKISKETRDRIQQHAKIDTSGRVYDHADYLPEMTEAMAKWAKWLARVVKVPPAPVAIAA